MISKILNHLTWRIRFLRKITIPQLYLAALLPKEVLSGPFKGMKYVNRSTGSVILPKLAGTYEDELHEIIIDLRGKNYYRFIDVGAAEGYYIVGIKKFILPDLIETIAFEATKKGGSELKNWLTSTVLLI